MPDSPTPAAAETARRRARPRLLFALAVIGVVLGGFGAMYSIASAPMLLGQRDGYVRAFREAAMKQLPSVAPPEQLEQMAEREADARYSRRNAQLPLLAIDLIVSCLLFAGATRALRGQRWGLAAWSLAATVAIPYQLLDTALTLVQAHELEAVFRTLPAPLNFLRVTSLELQTLFGVMIGGVEILYFVACLLYLRSPPVRALFSDGAGRTKPSA